MGPDTCRPCNCLSRPERFQVLPFLLDPLEPSCRSVDKLRYTVQVSFPTGRVRIQRIRDVVRFIQIEPPTEFRDRLLCQYRIIVRVVGPLRRVGESSRLLVYLEADFVFEPCQVNGAGDVQSVVGLCLATAIRRPFLLPFPT